MDKQTKHELWIVGAAALAPIPLFTAIALIAALQWALSFRSTASIGRPRPQNEPAGLLIRRFCCPQHWRSL